MKKYSSIIIAFITFTIMSCSSNEYPEKFSYSPESPKSEKEIVIKYRSDSKNFNNSDKITMVVYSFSKELDDTDNILLERKGEGWSAKFTPSENVKGLLIKFFSENGNDDNNEMGYVIRLTDANGEEISGVNAGLASVYSRYAGAIDLLAAKDSASKYFDLEFAKNPELKKEYLSDYLNSFPRSKRKDVALIELEKLENEDNLTQIDLEILCNNYKFIKNYEKADKYFNIIKEKHPASRLIAANYYTRFRNMLTTERMMEVFTEFITVNPESDLNNYMVSGVINKYADNNEYKNVQKMLDEYSQYTNSNIYNSVAWKVFEAKSDLEKASEFCIEGIKLARTESESPSGEKPVYMDINDWKDSKKFALAMILDTYGSIQKELDNKTEALNLFEEAVNLTNKELSDINDNFTDLLFELDEHEKAKVLIEDLVSKGKGTEKMRNILSEIFKKEGGDEEKFEKYIGQFDNQAKQKLVDKLKDEIKNETAPDFELVGLDGNPVKLSDFKGKTVIVDFWATWCGPCLQSFPVMKKAVEKYEDNPNVKFLFVNTWERVDDKKENAEDFMKRTKYPFHVLLDDKNEVVEKFKVQGIPTKFIIDGSGNIRFQSVGFSGVESEVLEELDQMISMIK